MLDNSVVMRWCFGDGSAADVAYSEKVMDALATGPALVPALWNLEVANVLARAERQQVIGTSHSAAFVAMLRNLPITADLEGVGLALSDTLNLARSHHLSAYDAAYLELALRKQIPLATLDSDLRKAIAAAGAIPF